METRENNGYVSYHLEDGDVFTPLYDAPNAKQRRGPRGPFVSYSIQADVKGKDEAVYLALTRAQASAIQDIGKVKDVELVAYRYTTKDNRTGIGVKRSDGKGRTVYDNQSLKYLPEVQGWLKEGASDEQILFTLKQSAKMTDGEAKFLLERAKSPQ